MFELIGTIPLVGGFLATVIPFVIVLSIVVFVHEYGHYIVGRLCGIGAEVFSLGFGPVLWSRTDKRGTVWQVAAIPMGGYVKFLGDADAASTAGKAKLENLSDEEAEKHFHTAKLYKRALTVFAGPAANFLLSIVVFAGLLMVLGREDGTPVVGEIMDTGSSYELQVGDRILAVEGQPVENFTEIMGLIPSLPVQQKLSYQVARGEGQMVVSGPYVMPTLVQGVQPLSPAQKAGLQKGDMILAVSGTPVVSFEELRQVVQSSENAESVFTILRDGQELQIPITPTRSDIPKAGGGFEQRVMIGIRGGSVIFPERTPIGPFAALEMGAKSTWAVLTNSLSGLYHMIRGDISVKNLQGPIGIAQVSGQTAQFGLFEFVELIAVISTAIGFINLFPIPVLDGGHLVMYGFEALRGKPLNERIVRYATLVGLSLLLTLMIFSTFNDIMRL